MKVKLTAHASLLCTGQGRASMWEGRAEEEAEAEEERKSPMDVLPRKV